MNLFITFSLLENYADPELIRMSGKKQLSTQIENGGEAVFESRSGRLFVGKLPLLPSSSLCIHLVTLSLPVVEVILIIDG